ncbi:MAG: copper oxidase [Acidimicrobiia bacterium]
MAATSRYRSFNAGARLLLGRSSITARITRISPHRGRWLATLVVVALVTAFSAAFGAAGAAPRTGTTGSSEDLNRVAIPNFDPATWRPTAELPLPAMESPITFKLKDEPSYWFDTELKDVEKTLHTRSLAAGAGPTTIKFSIGEPHTSVGHTVSSLVWPEGAQNMPFGQPGAVTGEQSVTLVTPGLYAFYCKIHPYMLGAAVIDDPTTPGADFGPKLQWLDGTAIPSSADEVIKTVRSFFIITEPANWQIYGTSETKWDPEFPPAPILTYNADGTPNLIPNLDQYYDDKHQEPITLKPPVAPAQPGVGTVYLDTQWEGSAGKTKYGSITAYDAENWKMKSKWFAPEVNLNHPHNYWSDHDGQFLYSTNWFGDKLTVFERATGKVLREVVVGPSPSHVMTRSENDNVVVAINGGGSVVELDPGGHKVITRYLTQTRGENPAMPHGFWVSGDGSHIVTPNANEITASIIDVINGTVAKPKAGPGLGQVAASITNDGKRAYVASLWSHTLTCLSIKEPACPTPDGQITQTYDIDLRQNYDKVTGESTGPYGLVPIQTPVSPDDQVMLTVGTVTGNIIVTDVETNKIVKTLPCGPGCHGINFGAKKGGGYYGYVSVKFANKMVVVDADPNGDGDPSDAMIAGELLSDAQPGIQMDDKPDEYLGQGGNGVEIYPVVYNGWVQKLPEEQKALLTCKQREPLSVAVC